MTISDYYTLLNECFGFTEFRDGQLDSLRSVWEQQHNTLVLLPTSTGKSLIYQLLGILWRRQRSLRCTVLVVSPLIALMQDQVTQCNQWFGVDSDGSVVIRRQKPEYQCRPSACQLGPDTISAACDGQYIYVFTSPERLQQIDLGDWPYIVLMVVDECHCVSEHGLSFRPTYLNLEYARPPTVPVLALSATVTKLVQRDIQRILSPDRVLHIIDRVSPRLNLWLSTRTKTATDVADIAGLVWTVRAARAIIYVPTRTRCEQLGCELRDNYGCTVRIYHAGLDPDERTRCISDFTTGEVVVATLCFGLGIDYPDIELVIHWGLPRSVLGYIQECGRGGRDGRRCRCILFFTPSDLSQYNQTERDLRDARSMLALAQTTQCRHAWVTQFWKGLWDKEWGTCTSCDNCRSDGIREIQPVQEHIQLLVRAVRQAGLFRGRAHTVAYLLGRRKTAFRRARERHGSVFGHGCDRLTAAEWEALFDVVVRMGQLRQVVTARGYVVYTV